MTSKTIEFEIANVTSEDADHPAANLAEEHKKGWRVATGHTRTAKLEITFPSLMYLHCLTIINHETPVTVRIFAKGTAKEKGSYMGAAPQQACRNARREINLTYACMCLCMHVSLLLTRDACISQTGSASQGDVLELITTKLAIAGEKKHLKFGNQPHNLKLVAGQQEWSGMELEVTPLSGSVGSDGDLPFGLKKLEVERLLTEQEKRERHENLAMERSSELAAMDAAVQQKLERERAHDRHQPAEKPALPPPPARMPAVSKAPVKVAPVRAIKPECICSKAECTGCGPRCNTQGCSHFKRTKGILRMSGKNRYYWKCVGMGGHFIDWADEAISIRAPSQAASESEVPPLEEAAGTACAEGGAGWRKGEQANPAAARPQLAPLGVSAATQSPTLAKKREMDGALRAIVSNVQNRVSSGKPSKQYPLSASVETTVRTGKCPRLLPAAFARATAAPAAAGPSAFVANISFEDDNGWRRKREALQKEFAPLARAASESDLPAARPRVGPVPIPPVEAFRAAIPQARGGGGVVEVVDICGDSDTEVDSDSEGLEVQATAPLGRHGSSTPVLVD
jgi:hypothetical protein